MNDSTKAFVASYAPDIATGKITGTERMCPITVRKAAAIYSVLSDGKRHKISELAEAVKAVNGKGSEGYTSHILQACTREWNLDPKRNGWQILPPPEPKTTQRRTRRRSSANVETTIAS